jgi:hypothetical protein
MNGMKGDFTFNIGGLLESPTPRLAEVVGTRMSTGKDIELALRRPGLF